MSTTDPQKLELFMAPVAQHWLSANGL